ncbi:MAG: TonB-dependent receptor [Chitinophagales bacterium]|nr:TonB-dependent receptor [Bacteroidota bacterium]MCB9043925.1 TonB-dependent receptor [Chitinophagales bacterium]
MKKIFYLFILTVFFSVAANAQTAVFGYVQDANDNSSLYGATILVEGTTMGTIAGADGYFMLRRVPQGEQTLIIRYLGYEDKSLSVNVGAETIDLGTIGLSSDAIGLQVIEVVADVAIDRQTPVAVSRIDAKTIQTKLGNQEFVEVLRNTPSIYATKSSGGFGDSRINIRGFKQEDVALLLNGIPVNGMEDNKVYWSNWSGLGDVTRTIQIQRGLGASKLAVASVGGTINIITKSTDQEKGGNVFMGIGNDGYQKAGLTLSTGLLDNGWAFTFSGSRTTGDGYVEGTYIDAWSYFGAISKQINKRNLLMLTGFGAPQRHGQRDFQHSISQLRDVHGIRWNDDYGTYEGNPYLWRENFYHKPQVGLSHIFEVSDKTTWTSSAYLSIGRGGGTGDIGSKREYTIARDSYGHVNFDEIAAWNRGDASLGSTAPVAETNFIMNGVEGSGQVISNENGGTIKRASMNEHQWFGILSNVSTELNDKLTLSGGLDARWYTGSHYRKIVDLLGADYWFDDDNLNEMSDSFTYISNDTLEVTESGNIITAPNSATRLWGSVDDDKMIDYHNDENINWYGLFGQLEYGSSSLSAFVSGALNYTKMRRIDYFSKLNSDPNQTTDWLNFLGGNVKAGANYNINNHHNVFANVGLISRAPYFDALFPTFDNDKPNNDAVNENVLAFELGYGYRNKGFKANINGYMTQWTDKTEVITFQDAVTKEVYILNLLGVDALHTGVEFDASVAATSQLDLTAFASIGNWQWQGTPNGIVSNEAQEVVGKAEYYIDGLKVGDAAQTSFGIGAAYQLIPAITIDAQYVYFNNLYAEYAPNQRSNSAYSGVQPIKLPAYGLTDMGLTWNFGFFDKESTLRFNVNNLFDVTYISEATDKITPTKDSEGNIIGGTAADINTTTGWFGFGRTWNATLKLNF